MAYQAAVITVSDKGSTGERVDTSGPAVRAMLEGAGYQVIHTAIVPDDKLQIGRELTRCADELGCDLVLTTGGEAKAMLLLIALCIVAVVAARVVFPKEVKEELHEELEELTELGHHEEKDEPKEEKP